MTVLRLATRRSPLALAQAAIVRARLAAHGIESEFVHIVTTGDRDISAPLELIGGLGVFAVEVQRAVLDGTADVAVHSAKDLPATTPSGLIIACVPDRGRRSQLARHDGVLSCWNGAPIYGSWGCVATWQLASPGPVVTA